MTSQAETGGMQVLAEGRDTRTDGPHQRLRRGKEGSTQSLRGSTALLTH